MVRKLITLLGVMVGSALPLLSRAADSVNLENFSSLISEVENQLSGEALAGIGDVNGDGYEDLAVAAPDAGDNGEGEVYILYGRANRIDQLVLQDLPTLRGESSGDHLGEQLGALGDINGDGYDDFALVSNYHDSNESNPGTIYLVYGQGSQYSNQTVASRPRFYGEDRGDGAGAAVHSAGDLNSDGYADFAIGATWRDSRTGGVYLIYGQPADFNDEEELNDYTLFTGADYDYAGTALANGDLTNDGVSDLIIAARRHDHDNDDDVGAVYIVPGRLTEYADHQPLENFSAVYGETAYEKIGSGVAVGDLNNDSLADLVISTSASDDGGEDAGIVYVVSGTGSWPAEQTVEAAIELYTHVEHDLFGTSITTADIDGDGITDLLAGAPTDLDNENGRAFVTLGSSSLASHNVENDYPFRGETIRNLAGGAVSTADLNNDTKAELVIAAEQYNSDSGKVYIGYWPIYTCSNSVELGGILADYPTEDYKLRTYAANSHYKIAVERHGRQAFVLNCVTNEVVQTLTFNERVQRKILARVFDARGEDMFVAVTRTPSKRRIKVFLYKQTADELVETDYLRRKWRPRGFRIKTNRKNRIVLQKGQEKKHRLKYQVSQTLELIALD